MPREVEETKAIIDVLHDVSGDPYSSLLKELKYDIKEGYLVNKNVILKNLLVGGH